MAFIPFVPMDDDIEKYGEIVSVEYFQTLTNNLNYLIDAVPVGRITPIYVVGSLNIPDPRFWQECDGAPITDLISPLRGHNTPDMISAIGTINSLTYRAKVSGTVTVTYVDKIPGIGAVQAHATLDGISFVAQTGGTAGNSITIRAIADKDFSMDSTVTVTVSGNAITIHLPNLIFPTLPALNINMRSEIVTKVNASAPAHALVQATLVGVDQAAVEYPATNLAGGLASVPSIGSAGNEIVSVSGHDIQVRLENGVSTIQGIQSKIQGFPAAAALVDVTIPPGTGTLTQPAPLPTFSLSPGIYLKGASNLATVGFHAGQNTKNLNHNHTGRTQNFHIDNNADTDDDRWSARNDHTHSITSDLPTAVNFEPAHVRIKHYIKIN